MEEADEDLIESLTSKPEFIAPSLAETSAQADPESRITVDEIDDEDEQTHDYRFLASLAQGSRGSSKDTPLVPRRGEKDFEPHGTIAQSSTLLASQAAMHDALSFERVHGPGFLDEAELHIDDLTSSRDVSVSYMKTVASKAAHLVGFFDVDSGLTFVPRDHGIWFRTMGCAVKGATRGAVLEPEEALYLCERGTLDLRFGPRSLGHDDIAAEEDSSADALSSLQGLPMSLQASYACFIGARGLTLERYLVYTGLKRTGYNVFRAPGVWEEESQEHERQSSLASENAPISVRMWFQIILNNVLSSMTVKSKPGQPLIGTGFFRDYATIYNRLSIIPSHRTKSSITPASTEYPALSPTFHAYRPNTPIRKSKLPPPEFYITVLDTRESSFPTATQLANLIANISLYSAMEDKNHSVATSPPKTNTNSQPQAQTLPQAKSRQTTPPQTTPPQTTPPQAAPPQVAPPQPRPPNLYARLKNGQAGRNVILAVVDSGLVSFIRVSEGLFADEPVWKIHLPGSTLGKGGGGGGKGSSRNNRGGKRR